VIELNGNHLYANVMAVDAEFKQNPVDQQALLNYIFDATQNNTFNENAQVITDPDTEHTFIIAALLTVADLNGEIETVVEGLVNVIIPFTEAEQVLGVSAEDELELLENGEYVASMEYVDSESSGRDYDAFVAFGLQPYSEEEALTLQVQVKK